MFDRATCPDQARLAAQPSAGLIALSALTELLRPTSSNAPRPGASSFSHEQTRKEGHGTHGFSQHEQAPDDGHGGRRSPERQIELFGDERSGAQVDTLTWQDLSAATQAVLTSLIARLILDHAETRQVGLVAEAGHDL